jgi:alkylhydroperoxidase family enzyme
VTTTWLPGLPEVGPAASEWDRFVALCPNEFGALADLVVAAWDEVDPVRLELCRVRMATLLGFTAEQQRRTERARAAGLTEEKVADLAAWPTSPRFDARERACLAIAEQFVIDANGVTDELVGELTGQLGPAGCYAFVQALSVVETFMRACLTLGIATVPDADELAAARRGPDDTAEVPR